MDTSVGRWGRGGGRVGSTNLIVFSTNAHLGGVEVRERALRILFSDRTETNTLIL